MTRPLIRRLISSAAAIVFVGAAVPALAQGSLRGKIVDESGKGVPAVEVVLDYVGDLKQQYKVITDKNGEWIKTGMISVPGTFTITVQKDKRAGRLAGARVQIGQMTRVADIVLAEPTATTTTKAPPGMSSDEIAKRNKRQAELEALFIATNAAIEAGNFDEAIAKLKAIIVEVEKCAVCYAKIGEVNLKKDDAAGAEAAYLKAIEIDPAQPGPYSALQTIYNGQRKFDEATKMGNKANELLAASGAAADPATLFNQGIIFWNQGKIPEAKAEWEKATKADPKMADAHYWLGMASLNQNKIPDARIAFNEYLKLAPTGQFAVTVKAILDTIK